MNTLLQYILGYIHLIRITDLADILIVAVIIYFIIHLLKESRAAQLVKGVILLLLIYWASQWLKLNTLHYLISGALQLGIALAVIFQPELRTLLERIGRIELASIIDFSTDDTRSETAMIIESVVTAACDMSKTKTGALIVIERSAKLTDYINTGTKIDAAVSSRLLENIFVPNTPLHDGAVIISKNRAAAASCLLPLTGNNNLSRDLGTRHRAAIGLSESTDAVIVVVSEETGLISIALNGSLTRNLSEQTLTSALSKTVLPPKQDGENADKFRIRRSK